MLRIFLGSSEVQYSRVSRAEALAAAAVCLVCLPSITIACKAFAVPLKHSSGVTTGGQQRDLLSKQFFL